MVNTFIWLFCGITLLIFLPFVLMIFYASRFRKVPPDMAMVIYSRKFGKEDIIKSIQGGGGKFIWPFFQRIEFLPMDVRTLEIKMEDVVCDNMSSRLELDINMITQIKACSDDQGMRNAVELHLKMREKEVNMMGMQILEDHARITALGKQVWEINSDRDRFAEEVEKSAEKDMWAQGLMIRSLVVKEISEKSGFFDVIGRFRTEQVKRQMGMLGRGTWDDVVASKNQQLATGLYQIAKRSLEGGFNEEAARELRIISRMYPENDQYIADYMRSVGEPVTKASLTPEGRREFIERREVAIEAAWEEHNKGRILMEHEKYLEAEVHFKKAMEIDPFESSHKFSYNASLR